jgi:hypothetical protein
MTTMTLNMGYEQILYVCLKSKWKFWSERFCLKLKQKFTGKLNSRCGLV